MKRPVRIWLGRGLWALLSLGFGLRRVIGGRRNPPADPRSVLIVRFDLMGDVVNALSAAVAARERWPHAHLAFMAPPAWQPIVRRCPAIDEVIPFDGGTVTHWPAVLDPSAWASAARVLRAVRAREFDVAVSVYGPIAGAVVALSRARWRVGYRAEAPAWSFDQALPGHRHNGGPHEARLATNLIQHTDPAWQTVQAETESDLAADLPRPLVVLHPGAAHGEAKRWPDEHWATLARELEPEVGTLAVVGLTDARRTATELAKSAAIHDLTGQTSLDELIDALAVADVVVSTDSGPGHLARALGRPVVMLHGPTDIAIHGPGDPTSRALRVNLPCGPCYNFDRPAECRFGDVLCMQWLAPEQVRDAVLEMIR
ncbi:MAG: glycosyltransferase family 9 protein [Chloroflexota bacterium]|nr:glycosyltransferase family 9 protein [Chloroflexota bacterium]MDE2919848.1 glycosyltransferase family 9 protein [Chloroflexota bacterium]